MGWDVRQTYYYLVCFATLIMMIIGGVRAVENGLDLALPSDGYRPSPVDMYQRTQRPGPDSESSPFTREELEEMADEEIDRQQREARRRALRNLIGSLALIAVACPVYVYHWRRVRNDEAAA